MRRVIKALRPIARFTCPVVKIELAGEKKNIQG